MARKGILYEQVTDAIRTLQTNQQKVTVRAIHAVTGGSMSTVLKHYRRWQSEQLGHTSESTTISPQLSEALHNELRNYARRALMAMESRLSADGEKLQEAESALRKALCQISELEKALQAAEQSSSKEMAELKDKLQMAMHGKTCAEQTLQQTQQHASLIENRLAEAETLRAILSQDLIVAQEQVLKSAVTVRELEQRLDEAEGRARHAEAQLQELIPQDKSRPQRNNAASAKPATSKPATDEQQEAFEF